MYVYKKTKKLAKKKQASNICRQKYLILYVLTVKFKMEFTSKDGENKNVLLVLRS